MSEMSAIEITPYIVDIMTIVNPLLIAYFGYYTSKNNEKNKKESEEYRKLREESDLIKEKANAAEKKKITDSLEEIKNSIIGLNTEIKTLKSTVENMKEQNKESKDELFKISTLVEANINYSRSASDVITTLGEQIGINDDTIVHDAITKHREAENKLVNTILHSNLK